MSQASVAALVGTHQPVAARYESGEAHVPADVMVRYGGYFDVSLDHMFGRTDNLHGTQYKGKVKIEYVEFSETKVQAEFRIFDTV